jgi:uncharacterized protein (UPF0276 family)
MYLVINYSPQAAKLVQSGIINIDFFKTPDWEWLVTDALQLRPVAIHFMLEAGYEDLGNVNWESVEHFAQITSTPYINLHLDSRREHFPGIPVNTTNPSEVNQVFAILQSDVMNVVERFGPNRVIVENSPFRGEIGNTLRPCIEPELITRIVDETGCGFLLDIPHAFISAHYIGMEYEAYFSSLPLCQVKEMHFAGIHHRDGQLMDHLSILDEDWRRLDWALTRIRSGEWSQPWLLAFEYGGVGEPFVWRSNPEVIAEQVPKLFEHIKFLND